MSDNRHAIQIPEMVQRVSRMIAAKAVLHGMERSFTDKERVNIMADIYLPWVRHSNLAREIIAIMREPTEKMKEAGDKASLAQGAHDCEVPESEIWKAMVDAALRE